MSLVQTNKPTNKQKATTKQNKTKQNRNGQPRRTAIYLNQPSYPPMSYYNTQKDNNGTIILFIDIKK